MIPTSIVLFTLNCYLLLLGGKLIHLGIDAIASRIRTPLWVKDLLVAPFIATLPILALIRANAPCENDLIIGCTIGSVLANICLAMGISVLISPLMLRSRLITIWTNYMFIVSIAMYYIWYFSTMISIFGTILILVYIILTCLSIRIYSKFHINHCYDQPQKKSIHNSVAIFLYFFFGLGLTYMASSFLIPVINTLAIDLDISLTFIGLIILGPILSIPLIIRFISLASKAQNGFVVPVMLYTNACNISLGIGVQCLTTRNFKLSEQLITLWIPNLLMITSIFWYIAQKRKVQKKCGIFLCIIYTIIVLCNVAMRRPIR